MLCCILIALLAPLGVSLAAWRREAGKPDCCRDPASMRVPWRAIAILSGGALLLCGLLVFAVLQSRTPLRNWPICTMFGLQDAKRN